MFRSLALLVLLFLTSNANAAFPMSGLKEAKTTAEILACAEKDDIQSGLRSKPRVYSAEYQTPEQKIFVAWYNPYSGRAACHVYIYQHAKPGVWSRKVARIFDGTHRVSVELGDAIMIRDVNGKAIHRYPAE